MWACRRARCGVSVSLVPSVQLESSSLGDAASAPAGRPAQRARASAFSAPPTRTRVPPENAALGTSGAGFAPLIGCPDSKRTKEKHHEHRRPCT